MRKGITLLVTAFLMLSALGMMGQGAAEPPKAMADGTPTPEPSYDVILPFRINSDAEFAVMATAETWPGDGSPGTPYIIDGYSVTGTDGYGIFIGNTTVHYEIRNCTVPASGSREPHPWPFFSGANIHIYNSTNGKVMNTTFDNYYNYGILIFDSVNNTIEDSDFVFAKTKAIELYNSTGNTVANNSIMGSIGLFIRGGSTANIVLNNSFDMAGATNGDGIFSQNSGFNTYADNFVMNSRYGAVRISNSHNETFINLTVDTSENYGAWIVDSENITFSLGEISGCGSHDFYITGSSDNSIRNMILQPPTGANTDGINIDGGRGNLVENCTIAGNNRNSITITGSHSNSLLNNTVTNNLVSGIFLNHSDSNIILGNNASDSRKLGIYLNDSDSNILESNIILGVGHTSSASAQGITLSESDWNHVGNTTIRTDETTSSIVVGIDLASSENNTLYGNDISDGYSFWYMYAIRLNWANYNNVMNNTAGNNTGANTGSNGIRLEHSGNNTITGNTLTENTYGVRTDGSCPGNVYSHNNASLNAQWGMDLDWSAASHYTVISHNQVMGNGIGGIRTSSSNYGQVSSNILINNPQHGIFLATNSNLGTVENNTISGSDNGIYLDSSESNTVSNNTVTGAIRGIYLDESFRSAFSGNNMTGCGFLVSGWTTFWNTHYIDATNMVNGKPVRYLANQTGGTVPAGAGQVILANCTYVAVTGQDIHNATAGIMVQGSEGCNITDNTLTDNAIYGILSDISWKSEIRNNTVTASGGCGLLMSGTFTLNDVSMNTFNGNAVGIRSSSGSNLIQANDFIGNLIHAIDDGNPDQWDGGYPGGGNFWDNYTGTDQFSGPGQNIAGSDSFGDTSYTHIEGSAQDNYPLMYSAFVEETTAPDSALNPILDYWHTFPVNITGFANETESGFDNVALWYRHSTDNATFGTWTEFSEDDAAPWYWIFDFPAGDGYYEFHSIATDRCGNTESKTVAETECGYDGTDPVVKLGPDVIINSQYFHDAAVTPSVTPITSYLWNQESGPGAITFGTPLAEDTTVEADLDGDYTISLNVTSESGRHGFGTFNLTWDTLAPVISLTSPANDTAIQAGTLIELDITDANLGAVTYTVNGGAVQTLAWPYSINTTGWSEGNKTVIVTAIDNATNARAGIYRFYTDANAPTVTLVSPANNSFVLPGTLVELDVQDANLDGVWLMDPYTVLSWPYQVDTSGWNDGVYELEIMASDIFGHETSEIYHITIDSTYPVIALQSPADGSDITSGTLIVLDVSDANLDSVTYWRGEGSETTLLEPFEIDTTDWAEGLHAVNVKATDKAGNNATALYHFTIDDSTPGGENPPTVVLTEPASGATGVPFGPEQNIRIGFSKNLDPASVSDAVSIMPGSPEFSLDVHDNYAELTVDLEPETTYTVTVGTLLSDTDGNFMVSSYSWRFTTATEDAHSTIVIGPVLDSSLNPISGALVTVTINGTAYTGVTNATGHAVINVPESALGEKIAVDITNEGFEPISYTTTLAQDGTPATQPSEMEPSTLGPDNQRYDYTWMYIILILVIVGVIGAAMLMKGKGKAPAGAPEEAVPEEAEPVPEEGAGEPVEDEVLPPED